MGTSDVHEWDMDSIMKRDIRVSDSITAIFKKWNNEYLTKTSHTQNGIRTLLRLIFVAGSTPLIGVGSFSILIFHQKLQLMNLLLKI